MVTTVTGKVHKLEGFNWEITQNGSLVVVHNTFRTVFPAGQWESLREFAE